MSEVSSGNNFALGIDTSKHQLSKVDYAEFKKAGGEFVFLRVGCGTTKDVCFEADYASAAAAGLKIGVYHYTYSTTEAGAEADAQRVLGWLAGKKLHLPVVYDVEDSVQQGTARRVLNSNMYNRFAQCIRNGGYRPMLYTGEYFFNNYFDSSLIAEMPWIAKYSSKMPSVGREYAFWQFSSSAIDTPYFKGALDRNWMIHDISEDVEVEAPSNPYPVPTRLLKRTSPMMNGTDVKWLQTELKKHGLVEAGGVDGWFGDKTLAGVRIYQERHSLVVDGIVGPATRASMLAE